MALPVFDATAEATALSTSGYSFSHTCSGSNRYLFVAVYTYIDTGTGALPTATYDSVSMTQLATQVYGPYSERITIFGIIAPSTGSNSVAVSVSPSQDEVTCVSTSYTGVHQTTAIGAVDSDTSDSSPVTVTPASTTDDLVIDAVCTYDQTLTIGSGQTLRGEHDVSEREYVAISSKPGAASTTTMTWTWSGGDDVALFGLALKPVTVVTLTVADATHGHSVDNAVLTQAHTLAVAEAGHGHAVDNVVLVQASTLAVFNALHSHVSQLLPA